MFCFTWGMSACRYILFVMEIWDMDQVVVVVRSVKTWPCAAPCSCNGVLPNQCTIWEDKTMCGSLGLNLHHHRLQNQISIMLTCACDHSQLHKLFVFMPEPKKKQKKSTGLNHDETIYLDSRLTRYTQGVKLWFSIDSCLLGLLLLF